MEERFLVPYNGPLAWPTMLGYFAARALPGVEEVADGTFRRTVALAGGPHGVVEISLAGASAVAVRLVTPGPLGTAELEDVRRRVARLFALGTDAAGADDHLAGDPRLGPLVAACPGLRPPGTWDPYETGVRAIIGQQVSVAGATTIAGRIVARCGMPFTLPGWDGPALRALFPQPEVLAVADLAQIGMPGARAEAVRRFAAAVATGEVVLGGTPLRPGLDELVSAVAALPGLGPWTGQYLALRSGYADAFPATDLGVRRALCDAEGTPASGRAALQRAEPWRPWRAHATVHLWLAGSA
jgi:AraC family transcriptional regulator of adaptative response / DNA-3-methyladenine glycosylase II